MSIPHHGSVLSWKSPHDDSVAVHPDDRDRVSRIDEFSVGDHIHPLAFDVGDPGRPQRRRRRAALAEPRAVRLRRGGKSLPARSARSRGRGAARTAGAAESGAGPAPPPIASSSDTATRPMALRMTAHVAPAPTRLSPRPPRRATIPRTPVTPKPGRDEDLDGEENHAGADQEQLLPADQPHQPVAPEEQREAADAHRPRHAEAGGPELHDDPEDARSSSAAS